MVHAPAGGSDDSALLQVNSASSLGLRKNNFTFWRSQRSIMNRFVLSSLSPLGCALRVAARRPGACSSLRTYFCATLGLGVLAVFLGIACRDDNNVAFPTTLCAIHPQPRQSLVLPQSMADLRSSRDRVCLRHLVLMLQLIVRPFARIDKCQTGTPAFNLWVGLLFCSRDGRWIFG